MTLIDWQQLPQQQHLAIGDPNAPGADTPSPSGGEAPSPDPEHTGTDMPPGGSAPGEEIPGPSVDPPSPEGEQPGVPAPTPEPTPTGDPRAYDVQHKPTGHVSHLSDEEIGELEDTVSRLNNLDTRVRVFMDQKKEQHDPLGPLSKTGVLGSILNSALRDSTFDAKEHKDEFSVTLGEDFTEAEIDNAIESYNARSAADLAGRAGGDPTHEGGDGGQDTVPGDDTPPTGDDTLPGVDPDADPTFDPAKVGRGLDWYRRLTADPVLWAPGSPGDLWIRPRLPGEAWGSPQTDYEPPEEQAACSAPPKK